VGAALFVIEVVLLNERASSFWELEVEVESHGSSHRACSNHNVVIVRYSFLHRSKLKLVISKYHQACSILLSILCSRLFISSFRRLMRPIFYIISFSFKTESGISPRLGSALRLLGSLGWLCLKDEGP
jgi:hypothetical protein